MADQPKSKFGGVPVDDGTVSKFGGIAVSDPARDTGPQRPGESMFAYLSRIRDSSRIDASLDADRADVRQIGEGVSSAVHANTADEAAAGASTAIRGGMKVAAKALPAIAPMAPVATAGGLIAGTAGSLAGQVGAGAAGAGPGTSSLAGDIAGILAGGMGARLANAAARILTHPNVLPKLIKILPKGQAMMDAASAIREAATPPVPETPGQSLAKSQGMDWAKLKPDDQALLETAARAQANTAAQPAPAQQSAAQPQQAPAAAPQPAPAQPSMTAADMLRQEVAAKQANTPQPLQGGNPAARIVPKGNLPVRPPLRPPEPPPVATQVPPAPQEVVAAQPQPSPARPAKTETTAQMVGATPVSSSGRFMGDETIKGSEPDKFFVEYTNPRANPGDGMRFRLAETEGTNGAKRFNVYRNAITDDAVRTSSPDASVLIRNGQIESVYVNPDWRSSGLFGQLMREMSQRGYSVAENSPKSASYIAAESKMKPPPARTLPQTEAAMAQKAPGPTEAPTSRYMATGDKKSPQLRAAEITGANAEAKAIRFAEALDKYDISPEDARQIQTGRVSNDQIGKGAAPKWDNVTDYLVAKGLLPAGEKPPVQSLPIIVRQLRRIRSERIARELADEMSKSGTSK